METPTWKDILHTALTVPGNLNATYCRFYRYSFTNRILLAMQGVSSPVATYKHWTELGYQVRKGSKAKAILRPILYRTKSTDPTKEDETRLGGFKYVNCLFQLTEVDPIEGKDQRPIPEPDPMQWDKATALAALDVTEIPFSLSDGNTQGYSTLGAEDQHQVAVSPIATFPIKTLMHELGHVVCGHLTEHSPLAHRGLAEFQAEAVAHLVCKELDVPHDESSTRAYIQTWLAGHEPSEQEIKAVFDAAEKILKAGTPADKGE